MYYTIYQTTNKSNGKTYIGSHKTTNLDDGYLGSGKYLLRAIEKQGRDKFKKEILHVFNNPKDMYDMEADLVNENFLTDTNTYNLKVGGFGGFDYINESGINNTKRTKSVSDLSAAHIRNKELNEDPEFKKKRAKQRKITILERYGDFSICSSFKGKHHSDETKRKIGEKNAKNVGEKSSQYGTMWITNGSINGKIKKHEEIPVGWKNGRVL